MSRDGHGAEAVIDVLTAAHRAPASDVYEADVAIFKSAQGADADAATGEAEWPRVLSDSENYLAYTLKNGCALRFLDRSNNRRCLLKAHKKPIHAVRFVKYHSNVGASAAEGEFFVWVVTDAAHGKAGADGDGGGGKLTVSLYLALRDDVTVHNFAFFINPTAGGPDVLILHDRKASILESSRLIRQYADATMDATLAADTRDLRQLSRQADRHSLCSCRAGDWFVFTMEPTLVVACTLRNRSTPAWSPCAGDVVRSLELLDVFAPDAPALLMAGTDARVYQWALTGDAEPALLRVFAFGADGGSSSSSSGSVPRIAAVLSSRNTVAIFSSDAQAVLIDCAVAGDSYTATLFAMDAAVSPPGVCFNRTQSYGFVLASNTKCIKMYQLMLDGGAVVATGDGGTVATTAEAATAAANALPSPSPSPSPREAALQQQQQQEQEQQEQQQQRHEEQQVQQQQQQRDEQQRQLQPSPTTAATMVATPTQTSPKAPSQRGTQPQHAAPSATTASTATTTSTNVARSSTVASSALPSSPLTVDPAVLSVSSSNNNNNNSSSSAPQTTSRASAMNATASPVLSPTHRSSPASTRDGALATSGTSVLSGLLQQLERGNLKSLTSAAAATTTMAAAAAGASRAGTTATDVAPAMVHTDNNNAAAAGGRPQGATVALPHSASSPPPAPATAATTSTMPSTTMPPPPPPLGSVGRVALHNTALPQSSDSLLTAAVYQSDVSVRKELESVHTVIKNVAEIVELTPSQIVRDHEQLVNVALEAQMTELQSLYAAAEKQRQEEEQQQQQQPPQQQRRQQQQQQQQQGAAAAAGAPTPMQREEEEAFNSFAIVKLIAPLSKEIASGVTRGLRDTLRTELDGALRSALGSSVRESQKAVIKRRLDEALRESGTFYAREVTTRMRDFVDHDLATGLGRIVALLQRTQDDNRRLRAALQRMVDLDDVYAELDTLRTQAQTLREALASGAYAHVDSGAGAVASGGANPSSFVHPDKPTLETMLSTARGLLASGKTQEALASITEVGQPALTLKLLREVNASAYTRLVVDEKVSDEVWIRVLSQLCNVDKNEESKDDVRFVAELMFDVLAEHDTLTTARTAQAQQAMSDIRHFAARVRRNSSSSSRGEDDADATDADIQRMLRGIEKSLV